MALEEGDNSPLAFITYNFALFVSYLTKISLLL